MKFITVKFITLFVILLLSTVVLDAAEWRGITPLKSTRADVERLLGKPGNYGRYEFENERASIHYKTVLCDRTDRCDCFVRMDTVLGIYVDVEVDIKFSVLKIDKTKFKKTIPPKYPDITVYSNWEEGIIYEIDEKDDRVWVISYIESDKDCQEVLKNRVKADL
jgi:hypothetical protein